MEASSKEKKWTSVRIPVDQYNRLAEEVNTPEAEKLGYRSTANAVRQAVSKVSAVSKVLVVICLELQKTFARDFQEFSRADQCL
ncbi:MAG TPA: hypothetical protein VKM55_24805 [Candidatus Lokiarchaeia archaeon]|nr:hypothetical protein [Candidatus Lokiarchaeia archaeon]